mmetsp:Transcript_383/g.1656  ORF Transcript_383/g.1656 Transcript_383/m.1656 type:complete len:101 (+) Transcript_383:102-404(+)
MSKETTKDKEALLDFNMLALAFETTHKTLDEAKQELQWARDREQVLEEQLGRVRGQPGVAGGEGTEAEAASSGPLSPCSATADTAVAGSPLSVVRSSGKS